MTFRTGLIVGLGVGFVLGARAGRERYDQLKNAYDSVRSSETIRKVTSTADRSTATVRRAAGQGLVAASERIRERAESDGPARA
jgi:hypothetical protein